MPPEAFASMPCAPVQSKTPMVADMIAKEPETLVDPASGGPLRRTWSRCQPEVEASAHYKDDPPAPNLRLSHRTTESSSPQPAARAVIFDPAALIATGWSEPVPGRVYPAVDHRLFTAHPVINLSGTSLSGVRQCECQWALACPSTRHWKQRR
jgi:hypothetical protein